MKLISIKELKSLQNGAPVEAVAGTVGRAEAVAHGQGSKGAWSRQTFSLQDGDQFIKVKLWGIGDDDALNDGDDIVIETIQGRKSKLPAMKIQIDESNGKTYRSLSANYDSVKIRTGGASQPETQETQTASSPAPATASIAKGGVDILAAKQKVCQLANLYSLCCAAIDAVVKSKPEDRREDAAKLFIAAEKRGYEKFLPTMPMTPGAEAAQPAAKRDWHAELRNKAGADEPTLVANLIKTQELTEGQTLDDLDEAVARKLVEDDNAYEASYSIPF